MNDQISTSDAAPREALTDELLTFHCPRCEEWVAEAYYGPCRKCLDQLKAMYAGRARDIEVEDYEPKMNVTPNAVALKDD